MATISGVWKIKDDQLPMWSYSADTHKVNFSSNGKQFTKIITRGMSYNGKDTYVMIYDTTEVYYRSGYYTNKWENEAYKTIDFGQEQSVTSNFYSWFTSIATQLPSPIRDLPSFLTNIANAIRTKKGTSETINAQDFASEIENLSSGGSNEPINITSLTVSAKTGSESNYLNYLRYGTDIIYIEHGLSGLDLMTITSNVPLVLCEKNNTNYKYVEANSETTIHTAVGPTLLRVLSGGDVTIQYYVKYD